jgi:hypothetical protein
LSWLRSLRNQPVLEPVEELIESILGGDEAEPPSDVEAELVSLLTQEHVIELDAAANVLGVTSEEAFVAARKATAHCLVLQGPPTVLLDVSGVPLEGEALS